jgi:ubiquitin fusion degradation protein 1
MMQLLLIEESSFIHVKSATLPKGSYVKLQPQSSTFLDISNPKAVLETRLRNFSTMTVGDVIKIEYNKNWYYISVVEISFFYKKFLGKFLDFFLRET